MSHNFKILFFVLTISILTNCNKKVDTKKDEKLEFKEAEKQRFVPNEKFLTHHSIDAETKDCSCPAQFELKDSSNLHHIKNQFYKSKTGHLYEKTVAQKEVNGHLKETEYFNGKFSQEVDPSTFKQLSGWYAKDKNNVYYYRPISGGMQISKLEKADTKNFKILEGHYKYGADQRFFYDETEIIKGFIPSKTNLKLDDKGRVIEMTCNKKSYKFELVN